MAGTSWGDVSKLIGTQGLEAETGGSGLQGRPWRWCLDDVRQYIWQLDVRDVELKTELLEGSWLRRPTLLGGSVSRHKVGKTLGILIDAVHVQLILSLKTAGVIHWIILNRRSQSR